MRRCQLCQSTNVRRSGLYAAQRRAHPLQSPYRCDDCDSRFWVVSRTARLMAIAGLCAGMAVALAVTPALLDHNSSRAAERANLVSMPAVHGLNSAVYTPSFDALVARHGGVAPLTAPLMPPPANDRMD